MRRNWVAVALGLLVVALIGVGAWSAAHSVFGAKYQVATYAGSFSMFALMGPTTLAGQANHDGTACLWVGSGSDRTVLIWPAGYVAEGEPLRVLDAAGNQVAFVGRQTSFGGGFSIQGDGDPRPVLGCGKVTKAWSVGPMRPSR